MPFGVPDNPSASRASYQAPQVRILSNPIISYNRCALTTFGVPTILCLPRASYQAPQVRILSNPIKSYNRCAVTTFGVPDALVQKEFITTPSTQIIVNDCGNFVRRKATNPQHSEPM